MAKKKKFEGEVLEVDEVKTESTPEITSKKSDLIETEEKAVEFVRENYKIPANIKTVYVSADRQLFYRNNTATVHGSQNNLKIFAIKWD